MTEQSNSAAERSAHVHRGDAPSPADWPVVKMPDGTWRLKSVVALENRIAELEAALEKQSAEIIRLRASIEKIARWYEDQAAYYEAQEQAFNRPFGDYGAAARFAQAKFQHRQQAAEIRAAALEGGKDE